MCYRNREGGAQADRGVCFFLGLGAFLHWCSATKAGRRRERNVTWRWVGQITILFPLSFVFQKETPQETKRPREAKRQKEKNLEIGNCPISPISAFFTLILQHRRWRLPMAQIRHCLQGAWSLEVTRTKDYGRKSRKDTLATHKNRITEGDVCAPNLIKG